MLSCAGFQRRTIVLHPPRETENVSRLTELKQRVGQQREGHPLSSSYSYPLRLSFLRLYPLVSALSRDISTTNSRFRTVKGLT